MNAKEKISKVRFEFLMDHPFLGDLALRLRVLEDKVLTPTMATDMKHIYYNPEFVDKLSVEHCMGVVAHEIAHCIFRHPLDKERHEGKNETAWRMACEYTVNHFVIDLIGLKLPANVIYDKKYSDGSWSTEAIYRDLMKNPENFPEIHIYSGEGSPMDGDASSVGSPGKGDVMVDDHGLWGKKDSPGEGRAGKDSSADQDWKVWIAQAAHNAKRQGKLPAGIDRLVGDILNPVLNWKQILAALLTERAKDDYSWRRPNRRQIWRGVYTPSLYSETVRIGYAMDTSGSMGVPELQAGLAEVRGICNSFQSYKLHLFACDAAVHHHQEITPADEIDIKGLLKGGGGTSFVPVFDKIRDDDINLDALVYFTDAYGDFPEDPGYPVIWVVMGQGDVPFGRRIQYE